MKKCSKCASDCLVPGKYYCEGGEQYYFCAFCSDILDHLPTGNMVNDFLSEKGIDLVESGIIKNMLIARITRNN